MGDGYGPMLVAKGTLFEEEIAGKKIAVPGENDQCVSGAAVVARPAENGD